MRAYQYTRDGYYAGAIESYSLLPNNATHTAPELREGHIPRWNGTAWEQVENHKGRAGYVNGTPFTVTEYGPLPEGWSDSAPLPTEAELFARLRAARDARIRAVDYLLMPDYPLGNADRAGIMTYRQALRDLPAQEGAPWDGGGEATPWPEMPAVVKA